MTAEVVATLFVGIAFSWCALGIVALILRPSVDEDDEDARSIRRHLNALEALDRLDHRKRKEPR